MAAAVENAKLMKTIETVTTDIAVTMIHEDTTITAIAVKHEDTISVMIITMNVVKVTTKATRIHTIKA